MQFNRLYSSHGQDIYQSAKLRTAESEDLLLYVMPQDWTTAATDLFISRVFYRDALPILTKAVPEEDVPEWLWRQEVDEAALDSLSAENRYRYERDIRDVLHRVAGGLAYIAWKRKVFDTEEDARAFYDELRLILLHRRATLEIAQWSILGLNWAYGISPKEMTPQQRITSLEKGDAAGAGIFIPFDTTQKDIFKRLKILSDQLALDDQKSAALLGIENADSAGVIGWKRQDEIDETALDLGRRMLRTGLYHVMDACDRASVFGFDARHNKKLAKAMEEARKAGLSEAAIHLAVSYAQQGFEEIPLGDGQEILQPSNLAAAVSVPDEFVEAALTGHGFMQMEAGAPLRHASAPGLWERVAEAIWSSGEPAVFFRDSARFLGQETGRSLSGGFVFLTGTSAPSSAINLCALARSDEILHVTRILVAAGEAALPEEDAYRPLHISITGLAGVLMSKGIAYDSDAGRSMAALLAAQVSGAAHLASADMAKTTGSFERFSALEKSFLQLIKDKLSALSGTYHMQKGVARRVLQPAGDHPLAREARVLWEKAYMLGKESGFRHAHLTVSDTDEGMQMVLNAQTRDIAPETSLVRFEGYFSDTLENAALYGKKLNPMVPPALAHLGYSSSEIDDIYFYAVGHGTLLDAPAIHHDALKKKGFHQAALAALEAALKSAQHIRYVFNKWTLGEDFCRHMLGFTAEELARGDFDMLQRLGFGEDDIEAANLYCCGTMTLEGAPHLRAEHLAVFDCLSPAGPGIRRVSPEAQVLMQASVELFLSGAAPHTVVVDHHTSIEDVQKLLLRGWEFGVKQVKIYREVSSLATAYVQPQKNIEQAAEEEMSPSPVFMKAAS